ncbi:hypothetical protein [Rivularia sp. UHCC 0363]|uniref:hypothetical protein n=1 Tax=Rivularia sp. UHCC 0363 TaxID=3110244 RepID=UPI002B212D68|nr:hypothetical protein [Rivularia sp. UHCC 0363]MEA5594977.1 hypothetical protein [Rivularia sp. UHCC 0363]
MDNKELLEPVVFRASFNNFQKINQNQAWSLFLTGGRNDQLLGTKNFAGAFLTFLLITIAAIGIYCTL